MRMYASKQASIALLNWRLFLVTLVILVALVCVRAGPGLGCDKGLTSPTPCRCCRAGTARLLPKI